MRLDELAGTKKYADFTVKDVLYHLVAKHGHEVASDGYHSRTILVNGKDYVYKFWVDDQGYEKFLEYVKANPSPFLPKVLKGPKAMSRFFSKPLHSKILKFRYAVLEKLSKPSDADLMKYGLIIRVVGRMLKEGLLKALEWCHHSVKRLSIDMDDADLIAKQLGCDHDELVSKHPPLKVTVAALEAVLRAKLEKADVGFIQELLKINYHIVLPNQKIRTDFEPKNIMMRGSSPVIIDPVCDVESIENTGDFRWDEFDMPGPHEPSRKSYK